MAAPAVHSVSHGASASEQRAHITIRLLRVKSEYAGLNHVRAQLLPEVAVLLLHSYVMIRVSMRVRASVCMSLYVRVRASVCTV